ncbi:hypothetical protein O181_056089 [Austropuccinia psidii MF-1]|uniref:Uncharacterized protein n=1 Tax=Austropuccinia psidii MF-1 TaxID=1389203 RepID=A0A9Q3E7T5_9BASI|nr:hypothetical protein [Austropuccinia psidii MF-1]
MELSSSPENCFWEGQSRYIHDDLDGSFTSSAQTHWPSNEHLDWMHAEFGPSILPFYTVDNDEQQVPENIFSSPLGQAEQRPFVSQAHNLLDPSASSEASNSDKHVSNMPFLQKNYQPQGLPQAGDRMGDSSTPNSLPSSSEKQVNLSQGEVGPTGVLTKCYKPSYPVRPSDIDNLGTPPINLHNLQYNQQVRALCSSKTDQLKNQVEKFDISDSVPQKRPKYSQMPPHGTVNENHLPLQKFDHVEHLGPVYHLPDSPHSPEHSGVSKSAQYPPSPYHFQKSERVENLFPSDQAQANALCFYSSNLGPQRETSKRKIIGFSQEVEHIEPPTMAYNPLHSPVFSSNIETLTNFPNPHVLQRHNDLNHLLPEASEPDHPKNFQWVNQSSDKEINTSKLPVDNPRELVKHIDYPPKSESNSIEKTRLNNYFAHISTLLSYRRVDKKEPLYEQKQHLENLLGAFYHDNIIQFAMKSLKQDILVLNHPKNFRVQKIEKLIKGVVLLAYRVLEALAGGKQHQTTMSELDRFLNHFRNWLNENQDFKTELFSAEYPSLFKDHKLDPTRLLVLQYLDIPRNELLFKLSGFGPNPYKVYERQTLAAEISVNFIISYLQLINVQKFNKLFGDEYSFKLFLRKIRWNLWVCRFPRFLDRTNSMLQEFQVLPWKDYVQEVENYQRLREHLTLMLN